jgi:hypothetical protein
VRDGSEAHSNLPLPAKRQKSSSDNDVLPIEQTVDTNEIACSISARTVEKIKQFSAFHNASGKQIEFDGTCTRENAEITKINKEQSLCDTLDSRQDCAVLCDGEGDKQESSNLSSRYRAVMKSMLIFSHLKFGLLSGLIPSSCIKKNYVLLCKSLPIGW